MARAAAAALALCLLLALAAAQDWQEEYQRRDNTEERTPEVEGTQPEGLGPLIRRSAEQQVQQRSQQVQRPLPERLQDPPRRPPGDRVPDNDFGLVSNGSIRPLQPGSSGTGFRPPPPPPLPPRPQKPPPGYTQLRSYGFYKAFPQTVTWAEALVTCLADRAMLVVPNSEGEAVAVGELYGKVKSQVKNSWDRNLFFVGASDLHRGNSYVTLLGTQFKDGQWHRWQRGEPTRGTPEHCIQCNEKGYYWDGDCQAKLAFVCRFQPTPRFDNYGQSSILQQQSQSRY